MVKVLFLLIGLVLGAVLGWYAASFVVTTWYVGTLRMIFVGDHFEKASLEFEDVKAKERAQNTLKYGLVKLDKKIIEDPDGDVTQESQGV